MAKIHEKVMRADFAKSLKRLIIFAVCVMLLGGGTSAFVLATQIGGAASAIRQREQVVEEYRGDGQTGEEYHGDEEQAGKEYRGDGEQYRGYGDREGKDREEYDFLDNMTITGPVVGALITLGITALLESLSLFLFWLLIAAWLYQAAIRSGMNGLLWLAVGLAGNVFGAIAFLLARSFIRKKCPSCGTFLPVKVQYCPKCGAAMYEKCVDCGEGCAVDDTFCRACGRPLHAGRN